MDVPLSLSPPRAAASLLVLGVSPSDKIKRARRRFALKCDPDVNKEANAAQEKFLRIKHAYSTLMDSERRSKYTSSNPDSSWTSRKSKSTAAEEQFYGFVPHDGSTSHRRWSLFGGMASNEQLEGSYVDVEPYKTIV